MSWDDEGFIIYKNKFYNLIFLVYDLEVFFNITEISIKLHLKLS